MLLIRRSPASPRLAYALALATRSSSSSSSGSSSHGLFPYSYARRSSTTSTTSTTPAPPGPQPPSAGNNAQGDGWWASLKRKSKEHGVFFLVYYTGVWAATGVGTYAMLDSGVLGASTAVDAVKAVGLDRFVDVARLDPKAGNLALAVVLNELLEPVRFPVGVLTVAPVHRAFNKIVLRKDAATLAAATTAQPKEEEGVLALIRRNGLRAAGVYATFWVAPVGVLWGTLHSGVLGADAVELVQRLGMEDSVRSIMSYVTGATRLQDMSNAVSLGLAIVLNEFLEPLRIAAVLTALRRSPSSSQAP